jgi:hypothetical protein
MHISTSDFIDNIRKTVILVTPWLSSGDNSEEYTRGWNDCVKEMRKRRVKYIKSLKEIAIKAGISD